MSAGPSGPSVRLARGQDAGFMQPILRKALPLLKKKKKNEQNKTKENTSQNDTNLNSRYRMGMFLLVALLLHLAVRRWFWVLRTSLSAEALCHHSKTQNVLFRVESSLLDSGELRSSTSYHHGALWLSPPSLSPVPIQLDKGLLQINC